MPKGSSLDEDEHDDLNDQEVMMILSDNSDDDDERAHMQISRLVSMSRLPLAAASASSDPRSSNKSAEERGRVSALYVDEKPWRTQGVMDDDHAALKKKTTRLNANMTMTLGNSPMSNGLVPDRVEVGSGEELNTSISQDLLTSRHPLGDAESTDSEGSEDVDGDHSMHSDLSGYSDIQFDEEVNFDDFTMLPNSFLGSGKQHPSMALYVDAEELGNVTQRDADRFVLEHTLMLRAILQLLQDHESHHSGDDVILKKGSLKKLGHSVGRPMWKVKYVEVGLGSFTYYEDTNMKDRKTILLNSESSVDVMDNITFSFELHTTNKKTLWMANSEEERQSWVRALQASMSGPPKKQVDLAPYQLSTERFSRMQNNLRLCCDKEAYLALIGEMWDTDVRLPTAFQSVRNETDTKVRSAADFWKFLGKTTVVLNGHAIPADSIHSAERVVGALSRSMLEYGRSGDHTKEHLLTEIQALSYARDVLMSVWASRSHDDSHHLIDTMTQNVNLAICLPYKLDPKVYLHVTYTTAHDLVDSSLSDFQEDLSGWVRTRSKAFKNWKNRYIVISESVLSYYAYASPRPHGLRGQIVLAGATLKILDEKLEPNLFIIGIHAQNDGERQLSFRDELEYLDWKDALQKAIDACTPFGSIMAKTARRRPSGRALIKGATRDTGRIIKGAADGGFNLLRGLGVVKKTVSFEPHKLDVSESMRIKTSEHGKHHEPTVRLTAEACSFYKIMTSDPSGNDQTDTWITVRARTSRIFLLSGGAHGRINKGEEVVALTFREGLVDPDDFGDNNRTYDVSSNYSKASSD
jgi:ElaB/YqjD/DUF883 family membrane-anchored ribosome-binding protein